MLNLLDTPNLLASDAAIAEAVGVSKSNRAFTDKLQFLHKTKRILYYRGAAGGYCLWPYTSINLERAYEEATQAVGSGDSDFCRPKKLLGYEAARREAALHRDRQPPPFCGSLFTG